MIKTITTICGFTIVLGGLLAAGKVMSQQKETINKTANHEVLEEICQQLSESSKYQYKMVTGHVRDKALMPATVADCKSAQACPKMLYSFFSAVLVPIGSSSDDKSLRYWVHAPIELASNFESKPFYMEVGKNYAFCARGPEVGGVNKNKAFYWLDHVNTVEEIK
jgi:hypothetical protein